MEQRKDLEPLPRPIATRAHKTTGQNPVELYLLSLGKRSREIHGENLERIARTFSGGRLSCWEFPWHMLKYEHTQMVRAWLRETKSPSTANLYLSGLRQVLKRCFRLELMNIEQYHNAVKDLSGIPGKSAPQGRQLTTGEVRALLEACPDTPNGARDAALVAVLYTTGLRVEEITACDLADYSQAEKQIVIREGKGKKGRIVPVVIPADEYLEIWFEIRGRGKGPMFCPVKKGGAIELRRMGRKSVYLALKRLAEKARVQTFSTHDLRRTCASHMLDAGADLALVQRLLGHENINTTQGYDRRPDGAVRKAAQLLTLPKPRRCPTCSDGTAKQSPDSEKKK